MSFSEQRSRRIAAGVCLVAGPGLALAGWAMFPSVADPNADWVSDIAAEPSRASAGMAIAIVGVTLSILGYMALVHLLRERQPLTGDIGGAMAIIGTAVMAALMGLVLAQVEAIRQLGDSTETIAVIDAIDESSAALVLWLAPILATVGLAVLAVGLVRAHTAPPLFAALFGFGAVIQFVGLFLATSMPVVIVGSAAMFAGLAAIGMQLLMETDEEWEHVPAFEGFHRASAA